jgi:hypothetical protein
MGKILEAIKPSDIDTSKHFFDAFGKLETETSARLIVLYLQETGNHWVAFSKYELDLRYNEDFYLNGLDSRGFLKERQDGIYEVTDDFVYRCWKASPKE